MAVTIRLRRMGKKKQPYYRVTVVDSREKRDGRFIEFIGRYAPGTQPHTVELNEERLFYWLGQGATCSDTVNSLLRQQGMLAKWHEMRTSKQAKPEAKQPKAEAETAGEEAAQA